MQSASGPDFGAAADWQTREGILRGSAPSVGRARGFFKWSPVFSRDRHAPLRLPAGAARSSKGRTSHRARAMEGAHGIKRGEEEEDS